MAGEYRLELHFDPLSQRALLTCGPEEYLMPDTYADRDAAYEAAQRFAWETLDFKSTADGMAGPSDVPVWFR